ncbi:hypothetical protein PsorP6_003583 [Peronosclerospora sorghi]|uniref:Uncharacterized protein n=1 Tax=Peronosclerospora sorghi TaxID=230839 RepID=A0ACC0VME1_9STRA|nr:hypothetical protein PsorP6_003583 [Peronosclerospora sorghi]
MSVDTRHHLASSILVVSVRFQHALLMMLWRRQKTILLTTLTEDGRPNQPSLVCCDVLTSPPLELTSFTSRITAGNAKVWFLTAATSRHSKARLRFVEKTGI